MFQGVTKTWNNFALSIRNMKKLRSILYANILYGFDCKKCCNSFFFRQMAAKNTVPFFLCVFRRGCFWKKTLLAETIPPSSRAIVNFPLPFNSLLIRGGGGGVRRKYKLVAIAPFFSPRFITRKLMHRCW